MEINMKKLKIVSGALMMATPLVAMAVDVADGSAGDIAKNLGDQASVATTAAVLVAALIGIVFLIMGGMGFKKYADNPQQTPLSKPMIFLAAGALLFGLSATSDTMQTTIFGDTSGSIGTGRSGADVNFGGSQNN
jgi:hypothetical protein